MFTNEFDFDETKTVIMDETATHEDVELFIGDSVFMRQWNEEEDRFDVLHMTPHMFKEILESMSHPEGMFVIRFKRS